MTAVALAVLLAAREREKRQAAFYRDLAAEAGTRGDFDAVDRLNALHADEQHHLARLSARILELGGTPVDAPGSVVAAPDLDEWETVARSRERDEIGWYERALEEEGFDAATRDLLEEILGSERCHERELGGKWMPA